MRDSVASAAEAPRSSARTHIGSADLPINMRTYYRDSDLNGASSPGSTRSIVRTTCADLFGATCSEQAISVTTTTKASEVMNQTSSALRHSDAPTSSDPTAVLPAACERKAIS